MLTNIKSIYEKCGRYLGAMKVAPTKKQMQICLFIFGIVLLTTGLGLEAMAQARALGGTIDASRINSASDALMMAIRGPFGALIMIIAGLFAIVMAAMGQYKIAMSLLVISLGSFILRSIIITFFNADNLINV
ncbi:MAG: hypothetical protein ACOX3T_05685 [Bdellovibrionota bacterium]